MNGLGEAVPQVAGLHRSKTWRPWIESTHLSHAARDRQDTCNSRWWACNMQSLRKIRTHKERIRCRPSYRQDRPPTHVPAFELAKDWTIPNHSFLVGYGS